MKFNRLGSVVTAILIIPAVLLCSQNSLIPADTLTIGLIGDQTGSYDLSATYQIMEKAVEQMDAKNPDLVLHVGDLVESIRGINSFEDYKSNFDYAVNILNRLNAPWYLTAGDHDVAPPVYQAGSCDRSREEWFQKLCSAAGLPMEKQLYYSFDFNNYHFISLYSLENLHTDPRWGPIFLNQLSDEQIAWLKNDLEAHKNAPGIIVLVHQPHWYVWSNWSEIHQILRQYPVAAVIAGHFHYDQDDGMIDQIRYLVMGATGGVVKNMDPNSGGSSQFATLKLYKNKVTHINLFDLSSGESLELTPRRTMDRLQALSCMLDNLFMDENIGRKNGQLFTITGEGQYSSLKQIGLESLANPIDLPIRIKISTDRDILQNPRWIRSGKSIPDSSFIELEPGERTGWANYTSVGQWAKPDPLWVCDLTGNPERLKDLTGIAITIKISFTDQGERWVESTARFPVKKIEDNL
ncbi:MAG: metallophosphoesterase [Calditrichaceae bacterium]